MGSVANAIIAAAPQYGIDPSLALEVAIEESGLNQNAVSSAGAVGVFQLEPQTAADLGVDPTDLAQNIQGGLTYLSQMMGRFGDLAQALAAYNWGPSRVASAVSQFGTDWLSHAPPETRGYVQRILTNIGTAYTVSPAAPALPGMPVLPGQSPTSSILWGVAIVFAVFLIIRLAE